MGPGADDDQHRPWSDGPGLYIMPDQERPVPFQWSNQRHEHGPAAVQTGSPQQRVGAAHDHQGSRSSGGVALNWPQGRSRHRTTMHVIALCKATGADQREARPWGVADARVLVPQAHLLAVRQYRPWRIDGLGHRSACCGWAKEPVQDHRRPRQPCPPMPYLAPHADASIARKTPAAGCQPSPAQFFSQ